MVFVLYKVFHEDNSIYFTGIFENKDDAKDKQKLLTQDKTPEENLEESFYIKEVMFITSKEYNRLQPRFKFIEEDITDDEYDIDLILHKKNDDYNKDIILHKNEDEKDEYNYNYDLCILFVILFVILIIMLIIIYKP